MKKVQHSLLMMIAIILMTIQSTYATESVITRQNASQLVQLGVIEDEEGSEFWAIAMSPTENAFLVATETDLWQYSLPDLTATRIMTFPDMIAPMKDMEYHPNGQIATLLDSAGNIYTVTLATGEITNTILRYEYHARYFASHPTQAIIAVVIGNDSSVPILDEQGEEFIVLGAPSDTLTKVVYSPDGRWLAIGTADDLIVVYDTYSWERHYVFTRGARGPALDVTALTFSPDSQRIVSGGFQVMTVWDNTTLERLHTVDFATWVTNIIYSHDEDMLIVSDSLGQLWFLDSTTYAEIAMFEAHQDWISDLMISPDGRYLVTISYDNVIQAWGVSG